MEKITAQQFAVAYAKRSGVTVKWLEKMGRDVRPCNCDYEECQGWQMVNVKDYEEELAAFHAGKGPMP